MARLAGILLLFALSSPAAAAGHDPSMSERAMVLAFVIVPLVLFVFGRTFQRVMRLRSAVIGLVVASLLSLAAIHVSEGTSDLLPVLVALILFSGSLFASGWYIGLREAKHHVRRQEIA